jgi:hypothetical protein
MPLSWSARSVTLICFVFVERTSPTPKVPLVLAPTNDGTASMVATARGVGRTLIAAILPGSVAQRISVVVSSGRRDDRLIWRYRLVVMTRRSLGEPNDDH